MQGSGEEKFTGWLRFAHGLVRAVFSLDCSSGKNRVFLTALFGEPVVSTLDSLGFRHCLGFRDFHCEHSTPCL